MADNNFIDLMPEDVLREIRIDREGKATFSNRSAARLLDIDEKTLRNHWESAAGPNPSKLAQKLMESGFEVRVFLRDGVSDTAFAILCEYYAFDAQRCTDRARAFYRSFASIGIRTWAQQAKGWQPQSKQYTLGQMVTREALPWERLFSSEWIYWAEKTTGHQWQWSCMGRFINSAVYDYLPQDVVTYLRAINPKNESGNRSHKHHQFLQPDVRDIVSKHLEQVLTLMQAANGDMALFEVLMSNKFGRYKLIEQALYRLELIASEDRLLEG
jgi:hypothetical protein